jgi:hypothetical protein
MGTFTSGRTSPRGKDVKGDKAKGKDVIKGVCQGHFKGQSRILKDIGNMGHLFTWFFKRNPNIIVRTYELEYYSLKLCRTFFCLSEKPLKVLLKGF